MTMQSIFRDLLTPIRQFRFASAGNVTVIFALSLVPMMGGVGAAIDYSQASSAKTAMQAAADAAALASIKGASTQTAAQLQSTAAGLFNTSFNRSNITPSVTATYDATSKTVTVSATANFKPNIMSMVGITQMRMAATSKATLGGSKTWPVCVLITNPTSSHTLLVQSGASIDFSNCMVQVNTANWDAVEARDTDRKSVV